MVTGGSGFIGSNFIRYSLEAHPDRKIVNIDLLTYAGNPDNLRDIGGDPRYLFVRGDICDAGLVQDTIRRTGADILVHFAAESHVDRSITDPSAFIRTNVLGTHTLLECARKAGIRTFVQVSTDEVYGSICEGSFREGDTLNPSSPYSASKAAGDLIARSYYTTYGLPVFITRCTNNFGPYQHPEKLIPLFITNLLEGKKVPVYGTGRNVRDWIFVLDHCSAIDFLIANGKAGEVYNIGSGNERTNLEITASLLGELGKGEGEVEYVRDRPGHDFRYSLDSTKIRSMGWKPGYTFEKALSETVGWYRENRWWWSGLKQG